MWKTTGKTGQYSQMHNKLSWLSWVALLGLSMPECSLTLCIYSRVFEDTEQAYSETCVRMYIHRYVLHYVCTWGGQAGCRGAWRTGGGGDLRWGARRSTGGLCPHCEGATYVRSGNGKCRVKTTALIEQHRESVQLFTYIGRMVSTSFPYLALEWINTPTFWCTTVPVHGLLVCVCVSGRHTTTTTTTCPHLRPMLVTSNLIRTRIRSQLLWAKYATVRAKPGMFRCRNVSGFYSDIFCS